MPLWRAKITNTHLRCQLEQAAHVAVQLSIQEVIFFHKTAGISLCHSW